MHTSSPHSLSATQPRQVEVAMSHTGTADAHSAPLPQVSGASGASAGRASAASQIGGVASKLQCWPAGQSPIEEHGTPTAADGL